MERSDFRALEDRRDRALPVIRQPSRRTRLPANNGGSAELGKGGGPIPWADASGDRRGSRAAINATKKNLVVLTIPSPLCGRPDAEAEALYYAQIEELAMVARL